MADDPTRDQEVRSSVDSIVDERWSDHDLYNLAVHPRLSRWAANWTFLIIKLIGPRVWDFADRSLYRHPRASFRVSPGFRHMDFDATLGFPGEGPSSDVCCSACFTGPCWMLLVLVVWTSRSHLGAYAMPLTPLTANDHRRAGQRSTVPLVEGRRVLPQTSSLRKHLYSAFIRWTLDEGLEWENLLANSHAFLDEINSILISYGRALYSSGRPYLHYVETINALSAAKPSLRRQLQSAWSLAFGWLQQEPGLHHTSMPAQVLLALLSTSLLWGWVRVAGCLALGWGALRRAGGLASATRRQLLLPVDVNHTINHALLTILEPKTRFTAAKHQCAKLDAPDLLQLTQLAFGRLQKHQKLWHFSAQTLRQRRCLDLGSLRAGGATWLLSTTENAELTRRRGRWINAKTMEIYVQEVSSATFLLDLDTKVRETILYLASIFPDVLQRAIFLTESNVPEASWPYIAFPVWKWHSWSMGWYGRKLESRCNWTCDTIQGHDGKGVTWVAVL